MIEPDELTPIIPGENGVLIKHDAAFTVAGVCGGKARAALAAIKHGLATRRGVSGVCTATGRASAQMQIVAALGRELWLPVRCHTATGPYTPEMTWSEAQGATIVQHAPGYTSVLIKRCNDDAFTRGFVTVPYGLEAALCRDCTARQVANVADHNNTIKRIVIPVGGGVSAAGVLRGLEFFKLNIPVLGIRVGADPSAILRALAGPNWTSRMDIEESGSKYNTGEKVTYAGLDLDAHYEAKCVKFLRPGDLFWVVGRRVDAAPAAE